jgi:hypothetical protein
MKIEAEKFKAGFELIDLIPSESILPSSQFVHLVAKENVLRMKLTGIATAEAKVACQGDISFYVARRELSLFLNRATGTITCEVDKKGIALRSAKDKLITAQQKAVEGYAEIKPPTGKKIKLDGKLLSMLAQYGPTNTIDPHLEVICFRKKLGVFATDALTVAACLEKTEGEELLLPSFVAKLLTKTGLEEIYVDPKGATLQSPIGKLYQPLPATDKVYPVAETQGLLESARTEAGLFAFDAREMLDTLKHVNQFRATNSVIYGKPEVDNKRIRVGSDSSTLLAESVMPVKFIKNRAQPEKFALALDRLAPWLQYVGGLELEVVFGIMGSLTWMRCVEESTTHLIVLAGME